MEERVRKLEQGHAVVVERIDGLEKRVDARFDEVDKRMDARFGEVDKRFEGLERKIDKLPDEWAMARVVFYVIGMMMAAIILGQRLLGWLP